MPRSPTVSVLIPCHNAARWIEQAISSALAAAAVTEVIVVDDGSTDGSQEIARRFGDRIRLHLQPQRGGNAARNHAARLASGEWLQFLDADDWLEPQKIVTQIGEAGDLSAADILYSPVWIETWQDGRLAGREAAAMNANEDLFTQWIAWHLPQTGGALWRRSKLLELGGWNEAMPCCQEHELYLRALQSNARFRFCPSIGAVYRIWSTSTVCHRDPTLVVEQRTALIDRALAWLRANDRLRPIHIRTAAQACFEMARRLAGTNLVRAESYYRERRTKGLILVRGKAAPLSYRVIHSLAGFHAAEKLAAARRGRSVGAATPPVSA